MESTLRGSGWKTPGAPHDYGPGRECTMGEHCKSITVVGAVGKINRFQIPYHSDENTNTIVLLCPVCDNDRKENDVPPEEYQGVMVKGRGRAYKLPNLRYYRNLRCFDQTELALEVGCNRNTIRKLERGQVKASVTMLQNIAGALAVGTDDLRGVV